ncbi:MAG: hypothetical protein OXC65_00540 [Thiotrichales bacterium]|nr:hypothetical protein [Thiotrichales bacterium]
MKIVRAHLLARLALAATVSIGLAACGGSSSNNDDDTDMMDDGPTLEQRQTAQQAAITTAATGVTTALTGLNSTSPTQGQVDTLDAAISALDAAIKAAEDLSDSAKSTARGQLSFAQSASSTAKANIAAAAKASRIVTQKSAISPAAGKVTAAQNALSSPLPTQAQVTALEAAIAELEAAINGADDVAADDADLAAANTTLTNARTASTTAQGQVTTALNNRRSTQASAISLATARVVAARADLKDAGDSPTTDLVARLDTAIQSLESAVTAATDWKTDETAIADANSLISDAKGELTIAQASVNDSASSKKVEALKGHRVAIANASTGVDTTRAALSTPPTQPQIEALDAAIKALETAINNAQDMSADLTAELSIANGLLESSKTVLAMAKKDREAADVADRKKMNEAPMKVAEAINDHEVGAAVPSEFAGRTITRTSGDAVIKIDEDDEKPYTMSDAPSAGSGWMGKTFVHTDDEARRPFTERGTIYTDIEKAGDAAWTDTVFNGIDGADSFPAPTAGGNVTFTAAATTVNARDITGGNVVPGKPSTESGTASITIKDGDSERGMLFGQSGRFSCASSNCVITRNGEDSVTFGGGTLSFDPDSGEPMVKYGDPDSDYTHFGYWMKSTTQRDGIVEHDIRTFAGGAGTLDEEGFVSGSDEIVGTADYYGVAAGVYVKRDGTGDVLEVTNGMFTADAKLTASFGGTAIAEDDHFSVSGTISDFTDAEGDDIGFDPLMLEKSDITQTSGSEGGFTGGVTKGGGETGEWSGQFYGNANDGNDNDAGDAPDTTNDYPENVSGEFNGHFTNGHVAGAFGAEYDE